jgi:hypothetical protein
LYEGRKKNLFKHCTYFWWTSKALLNKKYR